MDHAVALVQAYLHLNGYFTVSEYPVLEALKNGSYHAVTDIDLVALRLPRAGGLVPSGRHPGQEGNGFEPDPMLGIRESGPDLLIAEVKEWRAEMNPGGLDPAVLAAVLQRFGCCSIEEARGAVESLVRSGEANLGSGLRVRLAAFGSLVAEPSDRRYRRIPLAHVIGVLQEHLRRNWSLLRHAQFKNSAVGLLVTLEKARLGAERASLPASPALLGQ